MAKRRVDINHPRPDSVAATVRKERTSHAGARAFLASEASMAYAYDKVGLAECYDRAWLRPSAARRLAGYLDLKPVGAIGYRVRPLAHGPQRLEEDLHPLDEVARVLDSLAAKVAPAPQFQVMTVKTGQPGSWPLSASFCYDHRFKLADGAWSVDQPRVELHGQTDGDDSLLVALVSRPEDHSRVRALATTLENMATGIILEEVVLAQEPPERHEELERCLNALGKPELMRLGNLQTRERGRKLSDGAPTPWVAANMSSSHRMRPHSVQVSLDKLEEEHVSFASAVVFISEPPPALPKADPPPIQTSALTLTQGSKDTHVAVGLHGVRDHAGSGAVTAEAWDQGRPVDWDQARKDAHVLKAWAVIARALDAQAQPAQAAA